RQVLEGPDRQTLCRIGSVKTNIGHLECASGLAGVLKVALSMFHGVLPASLNCRELNPHVEWQDSPFIMQTETTPWPGALPAFAGVNSFGITGTNAHVILESATIKPEAGTPASAIDVLPLSAHSEQALRSLAHTWEEGLDTVEGLPDACY